MHVFPSSIIFHPDNSNALNILKKILLQSFSFISFWALVLFSNVIFAQVRNSKVGYPVIPPLPKYEVRAVWIATVAGLDWPRSWDKTEQQRSLREMVRQVKEANFNTIFFQVRGRADAMYASHYEPWAQQLTGAWGKDPGWDPLRFILDEAHPQGIEVHAWFNTFFVKGGQTAPETWPPHLVTIHPDWVRLYEDQWWLDPGKPEVRAYLVKLALDLVRSYDIDGIHFDFIRYPGPNFPDETMYDRYGIYMPKDEWRRANINTFVRAAYDSIMAVKPFMKVGSTPMGVYTNIPFVNGQEAYYSVFQDSRIWLRDRKHDYLAPQVYWSLGNRAGDPDFAALAKDWADHGGGRHIYVGIGAYKSEVFAQIPDLIDETRRAGAQGNSFFRYEHISRFWNVGNRYAHPAIVPPMAWKDSLPPEPPMNLVVQNVGEGIFSLQWRRPSPAADGDPARRYVVYRSPSRPLDITNAVNIVAVTEAADTTFLDEVSHPTSMRYFYAVTALDKGNNESLPTNEGAVMIAAMADIANQLSLVTTLADQYSKPTSTLLFIPFQVAERVPVLLGILDSSGSIVQTLVDETKVPGKYLAAVDIEQLVAGPYFIQLKAGDVSLVRPLSVGKK